MNNYYLVIYSLFLVLTCCNSDSKPDPRFESLITKEGNTFDLLITNGRIINGLDTSTIVTDLLVKNDKIIYIGMVDTAKIVATQIIDASEKVITPGFIDVHAHGNPLEMPGFENFLHMGVTTICLGQDGSSPMVTRMDEWMTKVDEAKPGVNITMFVGHGTLRHLSGIGYKPDPSEAEMQKMLDLLTEAFDAGCYGLSTGLEYTPGMYAGEEELIKLASLTGQHDRMIMSHMRNEDDDALEESIKELLKQGAHCRVHVSHLKSVYGRGTERAAEVLALLDGDISATADIYPYNASYTGIGIVFPKWAKAPNDYQKVKQTRRKELLDFLKHKIQQRNGPEATLFGTGYFAGRTLKDLSDESGRPYEEILLDIGPNGASGAYMVMDEDLQERLFQDEKLMVSSDGSTTMRHPRGYGTFAKIIETYVYQKNLVGLPVAIHKMTGLPAQTMGIADRGMIQENKVADLLIFDPQKIKANATFIKPKQFATGFDWVIVNGKVAVENGELEKERFGKMLRKERGEDNRG